MCVSDVTKLAFNIYSPWSFGEALFEKELYVDILLGWMLIRKKIALSFYLKDTLTGHIVVVIPELVTCNGLPCQSETSYAEHCKSTAKTTPSQRFEKEKSLV